MIITNIEGHVVGANKVNLFVICGLWMHLYFIDTTPTSNANNKTS